MLPDSKDEPPVRCEDLVCVAVSLLVGPNLAEPKIVIRARGNVVVVTTVPEASIDEYRDRSRPKDDVSPSV
jgi:hypothetical protein